MTSRYSAFSADNQIPTPNVTANKSASTSGRKIQVSSSPPCAKAPRTSTIGRTIEKSTNVPIMTDTGSTMRGKYTLVMR